MKKVALSRHWAVGIGFAAVVGLVAVVELFSFSQSRGVQREIMKLIREAERSTYLIGASGHLLSRLHAAALEALTEDATGLLAPGSRFASVDQSLQELLVELPQLLSAEEREAWSAIEVEIFGLRRSLNRSLELIELGNRKEAEVELDVLGSHIRRVFDSLRSFLEFNQRETRVQLTAADRLLRQTRIIQAATAMFLLIGIAGIALVAVRTVRQRDRVIASSMDRLEHANRELDAFAGRVAHDLRNVLAPLGSMARVLQLSAARADAVLDTSARLDRVTRTASDLISGLLAFSRAGASPSSAVSDVHCELERVLEELEPLIANVGATIEIRSQPQVSVRCEAALLHVLLLNLISNAVKFLEGRLVRQVIIESRIAGEECVIAVQDTGAGIPADVRERIFEPFFRAPGTTVPGMGLGLATVRRILASHGGRIEVLSEEGKGSRFEAALPIAASEARPSPGAEAPAASLAPVEKQTVA